MIELIVEDYCQNCTDFEPVAEHKIMKANFETIVMDTEVICKNRRKCQRMMTHLMQGAKERERAAYTRGEDDKNDKRTE